MIRIKIENKIITIFNQTVFRKLIDFGLPEVINTFLIPEKFSKMKNIGRIRKNIVVKPFCFVVKSLIFEIKVVAGIKILFINKVEII